VEFLKVLFLCAFLCVAKSSLEVSNCVWCVVHTTNKRTLISPAVLALAIYSSVRQRQRQRPPVGSKDVSWSQ
jgi:hypothetical protein